MEGFLVKRSVLRGDLERLLLFNTLTVGDVTMEAGTLLLRLTPLTEKVGPLLRRRLEPTTL